ncbi:MAG: helix-hairpin-helix domain-containing protein [Caldilinea sp.]|nr:helix-hairpin-helix domain-containing protein [Caldilinea sp.]MDW8441351.1 helix-hairpin-helix domain-containing protein [Caldilineaceae bacterium]
MWNRIQVAIGVFLIGASFFVVMGCSAGASSVAGNAATTPTTPTASTSVENASPSAQTIAEATVSAQSGAVASEQSLAPVGGKINLNDMTAEQLLTTIPNFGERMVREFFEYQPYVSIQQFRREMGKYVSAEQVTEYEKYVYVPIDINQADAETLKQIPGLSEEAARALIAARPYADVGAFLAKLAEVAPDVNLDVARAYLQQH